MVKGFPLPHYFPLSFYPILYTLYPIQFKIMDITVKELKEKLANEDGFVLIDVREPYEHEEFNVGGNLVPLGDIPNALADLEDYKDSEVIVYCRSGKRSANAQAFLQQAGFKNVRNLEGGMLAWEDAFGRNQ